MALVLDTDLLVPADREPAIKAAFGASEVPQDVQYVSPAADVWHRLELFNYGPGVHLLCNVGTGLLIKRTDRHVRQSAPDQLAVFVQRAGKGLLDAGDASAVFCGGELGLLDTSRPYEYRQSDVSDHNVLLIDGPQIGLSVEGLRLAKEQLTRSPLYGLARRHFLTMCEQASDLAPDVMAMIGRSTVQLVGAMVVTAADGRDADAHLEQTLLVRLAAYIDAHLQDPDLDAAQIAAAHYISVRHLYNVWARDAGGPTLGQSIIFRRLARARGRLAEGSPATLGINAIARQCGFTNVSHFSRRFRGAYGVSPTEWRAAHGVPLG
jgi:AraC family transcriptional activator of tynA and feaB